MKTKKILLWKNIQKIFISAKDLLNNHYKNLQNPKPHPTLAKKFFNLWEMEWLGELHHLLYCCPNLKYHKLPTFCLSSWFSMTILVWLLFDELLSIRILLVAKLITERCNWS